MKIFKQPLKLRDKTFLRTIPNRVIVRRIRALAGELNRRRAGVSQPPVFVSVLKGAFMFTAELLKHIDFPGEVTFVKLSSYTGTRASMRFQDGLDGHPDDKEF